MIEEVTEALRRHIHNAHAETGEEWLEKPAYYAGQMMMLNLILQLLCRLEMDDLRLRSPLDKQIFHTFENEEAFKNDSFLILALGLKHWLRK